MKTGLAPLEYLMETYRGFTNLTNVVTSIKSFFTSLSTSKSVNEIAILIFTYMEKLGQDFCKSPDSFELGEVFFKYYLSSVDTLRPLGVRNYK